MRDAMFHKDMEYFGIIVLSNDIFLGVSVERT